MNHNYREKRNKSLKQNLQDTDSIKKYKKEKSYLMKKKDLQINKMKTINFVN